MQKAIRIMVMGLIVSFNLQGAVALQLPWEKADSASSGEPAATIKVAAADSDMFPRMKANYVGGKTLQIDALVLNIPEGWYRGEKRDEDDVEAYLFACVPDGKTPVCLLRIEYDINEMVRGAAQVPEFLKNCRDSLQEDGGWAYEAATIGGQQAQCLRSTDEGDETLLLIQHVLKTYVPSIYVLAPSPKAALPAEAAAFINGITQK